MDFSACRAVHTRQLATAAAAAASKPFRSCASGPPALDAATQAAVLAFWTAEGALLPAGDVQPHQQTQQWRIRQKILRWANQHRRHRDVAILADYMQRMRAAAAELAYDGDPAQLALAKSGHIPRNLDPAGVIRRMLDVKEALAAHGIELATSPVSLVGLASKSAAAHIAERLPPLLAALADLPVAVDAAAVIRQVPTLLSLRDVGHVLQGRVAALQRLHPQLDVKKVCTFFMNHTVAEMSVLEDD